MSVRVPIFRILVVCTGNQCRSPAAERMLGQLLVRSRDSPFELDSAGTFGPDGYPIHPDTAAALTRRGVSAEGHVSRRLAGDAVRRADLILVAERSHRNAVLEMDGHVRHRTFTLREFSVVAADAAALDPDGPRELVAAADALRRQIRGQELGGLDLEDPMAGGRDRHEMTVRELQELVTQAATALVASASRLAGRWNEGARHRQPADLDTTWLC